MESTCYRRDVLAKQLGTPEVVLWKHMRRHGLKWRPKYRYRTKAQWEAEIADMPSLAALCRRLKCKPAIVRMHLRRFGLETDLYHRTAFGEMEDSEFLEHLRAAGTQGALARRFGVAPATVSRELLRRGLR